MSTPSALSRLTIRDLQTMKAGGEKIACLTAYDASFASVLDQQGVDVVLVGDSLGMVIQGQETTLPVSIRDIEYHAKCVASSLQRSLLMVDMPFLSFTCAEQALHNAGRLMKRAGAQMVKLEGNAEQADIVHALTDNGIPVCAHLGLQPQRVHKLGGYRVQGREQAMAEQMMRDAMTLQQAGADCLLLECVPAALAKQITESSAIPVIGIGAGADCDGQILVLYDILDISQGHRPRFSENFMASAGSIPAAVKAYVDAVKQVQFPAPHHCFE